MLHDKPRLIAKLSFYTISRYLSEALFAVRGFILAFLLGPLHFGLWTEMRLALTFLQFLRLGANEATIGESPYHGGRGDRGQALLIRRVASGFNFISPAAATLLAVLVLFFLNYNQQLATTWWCYACVGIFFLGQFFWYSQSHFQPERRFLAVSKMLTGFALLSTILGGLLSDLYGLSKLIEALIRCIVFSVPISVMTFLMYRQQSLFDSVLERA